MFSFGIQIICDYSFGNKLAALVNETCNSVSPHTLNFGALNDDSCISVPLLINNHDEYSIFNLCLDSSLSRYIQVPIDIIHCAIRPLALEHNPHLDLPTFFDSSLTDECDTTRIPLRNPADALSFFQTISKFKGSVINLSPPAKLTFARCLTSLYNTLSEAIKAYKIEINELNLKTLEAALTHVIVIPTYLLLFPSAKKRRTQSKSINKDRTDIIISERMELFNYTFKQGHPFLLVETNSIFNKPKSHTDKVIGKVKKAEAHILRGQYLPAIRCLNDIDTPPPQFVADSVI